MNFEKFQRLVEERTGFRTMENPTAIGEYFSQFYESVREDKVVTWSSEYASRIVRHTFRQPGHVE